MFIQLISIVDLCLDVFWCAKFREHKAAIKINTQFDVKASIPTLIVLPTV